MPDEKKTTTMDIRQVKAKLYENAARIVQLDRICAMTNNEDLSEKMKIASEAAIKSIAAVLMLLPDIVELPFNMEELKNDPQFMIVGSKEEAEEKLIAHSRNLPLVQGGSA